MSFRRTLFRGWGKTPEQIAAEHENKLQRRAERQQRKGELRQQKREGALNWRKEAYRNSFDPLAQEATQGYKVFESLGNRVLRRGMGAQGQAIQSYGDVLSGTAPSLSELAVSRAADRAAQTGLALASSGRGNPALALRSAVNNAAMTQQEAARDAGQIRLQEQEAARAALASIGDSSMRFGLGTAMDAQDAQVSGMRDERDFISGVYEGDRSFSEQQRQRRVQQGLAGAGAGLNSMGGVLGRKFF